MNWLEPVDLYCERVAAGLWGEPLNALSSLAFLVAAFVARRAVSRAGGWRDAPDLHLLWLLIALVGLASVAFHLFAQRWAGVLDVLVIAIYLHFYVATFLARGVGMRWSLAWIGMPAFYAFARGVDGLSGAALTDPVVRGTIGYLPALCGLALLAAWLRMRGDARWVRLGAAAAVFVASLALRQLDLPICAAWPMGTHAAWHVLNAVVLWLSVGGLLPRRRFAAR